MSKAQAGRVVAYQDGKWTEGNQPILGPKHHAVWLSSIVFDGARAIGGRAPDLDLHCARSIRSARILGLRPMLSADEVTEIAWDGIHRFEETAELYICPMFYAESGFIVPDADSTRFILSIYESPLPRVEGFSACLSSYRRPSKDMAPTEAKAGCLYPNVSRAVAEAEESGFDTAVMLDPNGNVAEFAYANLFMAKDATVYTPAVNGTFLNGITRQRVIRLLRDDGIDVLETALEFEDLMEADEIFGTGNYYKVAACTRLEDREIAPGPLTARAKDLYWGFAGF